MVENSQLLNVSCLSKLAECKISLKLTLEPLFFSSYMGRALSKVASITPDIMLRVCILVLTCGNLFNSSINSNI